MVRKCEGRWLIRSYILIVEPRSSILIMCGSVGRLGLMVRRCEGGLRLFGAIYNSGTTQ